MAKGCRRAVESGIAIAIGRAIWTADSRNENEETSGMTWTFTGPAMLILGGFGFPKAIEAGTKPLRRMQIETQFQPQETKEKRRNNE